jgi:hypothetical protein
METPTPTKKRNGPIPKGYQATSVQLVPEVLQWAVKQPEGLSGLVRKLLEQEMGRRLKRAKAAQ